jgi:hypothetical protein
MQIRAGILPVLAMAATACAQTTIKSIQPAGAPRSANTSQVYATLRGNIPGAESLAVKGLRVEREGGVFHFDDGTFYLYQPVDGHVTGAVFEGKGSLELAPKAVGEKRSLALLTKSDTMSQDFSSVVLRFTDGTADEIRKASTGAGAAASGHVRSVAEDFARDYRKDLGDNLELRMLADVIGGGEGQFFLASFRMGNLLTGRNVLFVVDPEGTSHIAPDEVELSTWGEFELQTWVGYRMQAAGKQNQGKRVRVTDETLDVTIDRSAMMKVSAETTIKVLRDGVRVVPLGMYPTLRVSGVYNESGMPLDFVQEDKKLDPQFGVILPTAAKAGDTLRLLTVYGGKDALLAEGNDTYYLQSGARESWYPSGPGGFGDFANFHMTFHIPKFLQIVATGNQVSVTPEGDGMAKAVWQTDAPIPVAGFNLGDFKSKGAKTPQGFGVSAYADVGLPEWIGGRQGVWGGSTVPGLPDELAQGLAAVQVYSNFFGKLPYDHVALTEQTTCSYGQSWPMLVYLPMCAFLPHFSTTGSSYWTVVTPHEVAHQWWGSLVGFNSYRDQWMSEGFAQFSAGVYLLYTRKDMGDYRDFWKKQQKDLLEKNPEGKRPIDVGALTMGGRVSNEKTGNAYQALIYGKGAYVLHMLEMQMWTPEDQEAAFKHSMQQFVAEYAGKVATTEDWKRSMEKTMPKSLDLRGDGKLDWFFDEYVYGTELPHYTISSEFSVADGVTSAHLKLAQSNVSDKFVMRVPLYLQMANGNTVRITNVVMRGNKTIDTTITLGKLPSPGKALILNYNADVLSDL